MSEPVLRTRVLAVGLASLGALSAPTTAQQPEKQHTTGHGVKPISGVITPDLYRRPFVPPVNRPQSQASPKPTWIVPIGVETPLGDHPESPPPVGAAQPASSGTSVRLFNKRRVTFSGQSRSTVGEPTCARWNDTILYTHNWDGAISTNDGATWSRRDPRRFTSLDSGFCCDQYAMYVPTGGKMVVWLIQYKYSSSTRNGSQRIIVYTSEANLRSGASKRYDFNPRDFGFSSSGGNWLDFPHLAYSRNYLYATSNVFDDSKPTAKYKGTVCWRMNLSDLKAGRDVRFTYYTGTSGSWRLSYGASDTMYWWQHVNTSRGRLFRWPENGSVSSSVVDVGAWTQVNATNSRCNGPDGRNWLGRAWRLGSRPLACAVANGLVTVMWDAAPRTGRPNVYTRVVQIRESDNTVALDSDIWSSTICFAYPSLAVNARGHLGGSIGFGSATRHASTAFYIADDLVPIVPFRSQAAFTASGGPADNAWGDYLSCTRHPLQPNTWIATGMNMDNAAGKNNNQSPMYVHFGRDRDVDRRPDFTPTSLTCNVNTLIPNFNATITSVITNQGYIFGSPRCSHRLSTDSTISTNDQLLYQFTIKNLPGVTSKTTTHTVRIPSVDLPSTCYLGAIADDAFAISEIDETNNTLALARSGQPRRADLTPTALSASSTNLIPSVPINIRSTIKNQGSLESAAVTSGYYLSTDSTIGTRDTLLGSFSTDKLAVDATQEHNMNVQVPQNTGPGSCYLGVYVDRLSELNEAFESNNTRSLEAACLTPFADLKPASIFTGTNTVRRGAQYQVNFKIENDGNQDSTACASGCYMSTDMNITTADTLVAGFTTPAISARNSWIHSMRVTIPVSVRLGQCYIGLVVDQNNTVRESLENNNTIARVLTCDDGTPDLVIQSVTASPSTLVGGSSVTITSKTQNSGAGLSGSATTMHLISADSTITLADILCGSYTTGSLAIGASITRTTVSTVPRCIPTGTCYVAAVADALRAVDELDENNNTRSQKVICRRFGGAGHWVDFQPQLGSAANNTTEANYSLQSAPRHVNMCVVSPSRPNHWYLLLWSRTASPGFDIDATTNLSLGLLNSSAMPFWFGKTDASGTNVMPQTLLPAVGGVPLVSIYTHSAWFDPALTTFLGFGSNAPVNRIKS